MTKYVKVGGYYQKRRGKRVHVSGFRRKQRKKGRKIKYRKLGDFYVARDQYGNFRGSKVVRKRKKYKARKLIKK